MDNRPERTGPALSRKKFLKWAGVFSLLPFLYLWYSVIKVKNKQESLKEISIPLSSIDEGLSFHGPVIINREVSIYSVFSSACPHLGCTISEATNGNIVCPCHGSRFNFQGKVVKGPASGGLRVLAYKIDRKTETMVVEL